MAHIELLEYEDKNLKIVDERICDKEGDNTIGDRTLEQLMEINEKYVDAESGVKRKFLDITVYPHRKEVKLKAKNWVGIVTVNDFTIEILPKFIYNKDKELKIDDKERIIKNLIKMLQVAWNIPYRDAEISSLKIRENGVFEVFITIFASKLLDEIKEGLYREYVHISEDLKYVKGQIDFAKYSKRWDRRHIIPINYNDRTVDNTLNRVLRYATFLASKHTKDSHTFTSLKVIDDIMNFVSFVSVNNSHLNSITFNRLNERYKPLFEMARMIILNLSPEFTGGGRKVFTFLIPMERVFEGFIANTLVENKQKIFGEITSDIKMYIQGADRTRYLLKGSRFRLIPDIMIKYRGKRYVIDTKYKTLDSGDEKKYGVSQSDVYQMMAYAFSYDAQRIMLLYPKTIDKFEGKEWEFDSVLDKLNERKLLVEDIDLRKLNLIKEYDVFINALGDKISKLMVDEFDTF